MGLNFDSQTKEVDFTKPVTIIGRMCPFELSPSVIQLNSASIFGVVISTL